MEVVVPAVVLDELGEGSCLAQHVIDSLGIAATRRLGAKVASVVGLTEVLFAIAFAAVLVGQLPGLGQLAGGLVVLAGVALVQVDDARASSTRQAATARAPQPSVGRIR